MTRAALTGCLVVTVLLVWLANAPVTSAHDVTGGAATGENSAAADRDREEASVLSAEIVTIGRLRSRSPAIAAALAAKAERRRQLIVRLAKSRPSAVLDLALSGAERASLPPDIQPLVEQRTSQAGELQVIHIDHDDGHAEYDARLVNGGQRLPLRFGAPLGQARPGDRVVVDGVSLAGDPIVVADQVVVQSTGQISPTGNQRTAIILVMAPGVSSHPYANKASTASLFFSSTSGQSARAFFTEASYTQSTIVGGSGQEGSAADVYGPYSIASSDCRDGSTIATQAADAADPQLNFNNYERIVFSIINPPCQASFASLGGVTAGFYDGAEQFVSASWVFNFGLGSTAFNGQVGLAALHELGHNLGVYHANSLECGAVAIGGGTCASIEYGDPSDVMGLGPFGHLNGVHKDKLGWLNGRSQVATISSTYVINAYESASLDVKVLKIPRTRSAAGAVTSYYYLEYRKPTPSWSQFLVGRPEFGNGVLIHASGTTPFCPEPCPPDFLGAGGGGDSLLIDTLPASRPDFADVDDAPLTSGETFSDPSAGVTLQVVSTSATSASIQVSLSTPRVSVLTMIYPETAGTISGGGGYARGQSVTLTASSNFCFRAWRENRVAVSFLNPYTFTATADRTLEAVFDDAPCAPRPPNDTFPGPGLGNGQVTVNTTGATTEAEEPFNFCGTSTASIGKTVWYTITPTAFSLITLSTNGSDFPALLAVSTGNSVGGLTPLVCGREVYLTASAGTTYHVQLGGYEGAGGNAVLTMRPSEPLPGPRAAGPLVVSPAATMGGTATVTLAIENRDTVATPPIYPILTGENALGQTWYSPMPLPTSAVIQPGQTASFTYQIPVPTAGLWAVTTLNLFHSGGGGVYRGLVPLDPQGQRLGFMVAMNCTVRPRIAVTAVPSGDGRLAVTIAAGATDVGNRLYHLQFGPDPRIPNPNVLIDLPAVGNGHRAGASIAIPNSPPAYTFYVRRETPGVPITLPITVSDGCGSWSTFVGGGTAAGF